jgi:hypothetical protein
MQIRETPTDIQSVWVVNATDTLAQQTPRQHVFFETLTLSLWYDIQIYQEHR